LRNVRATYDPGTRDTLYNGRPFREDSTGSVGTRPWYVNNEPIVWEGRRYTKYGPPRVLLSDSLRRAGEHQGVVFFVEANTTGTPGVIYVPTRPGCEFHLYQWDLTSGGIRGER
jgi:hypothetical protein